MVDILPASECADLPAGEASRLLALVEASRRLVVLTGAGCSTESGIPDYRDEKGEWKHRQPMTFQEFVGSAAARRRYWARSAIGWRRIADARPNDAHRALARLEARGLLDWLVTQNVDGLHRRAGSRQVTDLHGRLDRVECLECRTNYPRQRFQTELERLNPGWERHPAGQAPDGDARLEEVELREFQVPSCMACGGALKPAVVFFGESIPKAWLERAFGAARRADLLLVVGTSLMVGSAFRMIREAVRRSTPIVAINRGVTRADADIELKIEASCGTVLRRLVDRIR